jgi:hypothetical protein
MRRDEEIKELIQQIGRLQIQQSTLVTRLSRLNRQVQDESRAQDDIRTFSIGDKVRVRNPKMDQASKGKIIRITDSRITMEARNGEKVWRAPSNFILEERIEDP